MITKLLASRVEDKSSISLLHLSSISCGRAAWDLGSEQAPKSKMIGSDHHGSSTNPQFPVLFEWKLQRILRGLLGTHWGRHLPVSGDQIKSLLNATCHSAHHSGTQPNPAKTQRLLLSQLFIELPIELLKLSVDLVPRTRHRKVPTHRRAGLGGGLRGSHGTARVRPLEEASQYRGGCPKPCHLPLSLVRSATHRKLYRSLQGLVVI